MPALSVVFVLKTEKGVPERIGCGVLEGSEEELTTIFARSDNAAAVPPLLIDGYTRELPPLQTLTPLHLKAAEGDQGLSKYAAYLQQRNKSAVIKLAGNNKGRLLFLSPDPKSKHLLLCYLHTPTARPAVGPPILPPLSLEARVEAALSVFATDPDFNGPLSFE